MTQPENPYDALIAGDDAKSSSTPANPYDALLEQDESSRLRAAALATASHNRDAYARANEIAQRNGWPVEVVANDPTPFEERDRLNRLDALRAQSPKTAQFLTDPNRMALAKGEEEKLGELDRALNPGDAPKSFLGRTVFSLLGALGRDAQASNRTLLQGLDDFSATAGAETRSLLAATGEWLAERDRDIARESGSADVDEASLLRESRAGLALAGAREAERTDMAARRATASAEADAIVQSYPDNSLGYHAMGVARSLPLMAAAVATRNPELGALIIGGGTAAEQRSEVLADGGTREQATASAVAQGSIEAGFDALTLGIAKWGVGPIKDALVRRFGSNVATRLLARATASAPGRFGLATLEGAATEVPTTAAQMATDELILDKDYSAADYARGARDSAIQGGAVAGAVYAGTAPLRRMAMRSEGDLLERMVRSAVNAGQVQRITDIAANLQLGKHSPQVLAQFVREVGGDGNVYLAADQARTLFQSERVSADEALGELLGDPAALATAEAAGGDVVIPMAVYASKIVHLPNGDEIAKHVRLSADDYSVADLDSGRADEELAAAFGRDAPEATPEAAAAVERVRQDVLGQLLATNRYSPADAERQAKLYGAVFRALGQRTGHDAWSLYERYSLRIRGAKPDILRQRPNTLTAKTDDLLTAARAGELPSESEAFGPSLSEFLRERGIGAADGMEGEVRRLAESERVGRGGTRRLFRADDPDALGLDRAREAAAEAGYLSADSTLSDFIDLLEQDITGRPVYSPANENRRVADRRTSIIDLQNAIAEAFPDVAELAAVSNQDVADRLFGVETLEQPGIGRLSPEQLDVLRSLGLLSEDQAADLGRTNGGEDGQRDERGFRVTGDAEGARFLSAFPENARITGAGTSRLLASIKAVSERAVDELGGVAEAAREVAERPLGPFSGYRIEGEVTRRGEPQETLLVKVYGLEQIEAGLTGEPALTFTVNTASGEFSVNGPEQGSDTFRAFKERGWADQAHGAGGVEVEGWTALRQPDGKTMPVTQLIQLLGDVHARLRTWRREDRVGLHWSRVTGATGGPMGREGAAFFQSQTPPAGGVSVSGGTLFQDDGYRIAHRAPGFSRGAPLNDLSSLYGDDIYGRRAAEYFGHFGGGDPMDRASVRLIQSYRDKPNAPVKIYRAVPKDAGDTINSGDWVTITREYAVAHGDSALEGDYKILEMMVPARDLYTNGDSIHEFGYDPEKLYQQTAGTPRGQIDIAPDLRMSITLLDGADLSTFLHESGHFFLEVLADLSRDPASPVAGDFDKALQWFGIEGDTAEERAEVWGAMTLEQRRPFHEQWARGFEAYLGEGKAPSVELASLFGRFKSWMLSIYRSLRALDVTLTPEVRGVFDRLLATDEEIALVEQRQGMAEPLVPASEFKTLGLTEAQWADYRAMLEAGSEEARAEVFQRLHKAYRREAESWWKEERAKVRAEVVEEYEAEPVVRAWRILAGRKIEGLDPALVGLKLDRDALLARYSKEYVQGRLKPLGVYVTQGGVDPDTAAVMLGLPSGDALVQGLATVKERLARVEAETDARMRERHPDPLTDGSLPELAERAVHNNARMKALQFELDLLAKLAGQSAPTARAIRLFAQREIGKLTVRNLRPNDYLAAERKWARETTKAAVRGDFAAALLAKRNQAAQAALYREAREQVDQVDSHVTYLRKFDKPATRQRIGKAGGDLLDMIDGVLAAYSFRPQSDKARERASTLRQWYERMLAQGVEPQVDPKVLAQIEQSRLTHYRELTVTDLSAVVELVKQLEHQAKEANEVRLAGETLWLEMAGDELATAITADLKHRGPPPISQTLRNTPGQVSRKAARFAGAVLLRLRTLAHWVDGEGNVEGAFHRLIVRPLDRAQAAYLDAMGDYGQKIIALFDAHLRDQDLTAPIWIPSLNQNLTKQDILAAALNTGNASNLQRLRDGMGWGDVQMRDVLRHLTESDWQFVQSVWDTLETLWPQIAEQHKRLTGVAPPKVEAIPVQTPYGVLRGGYYPLMYDKDSPQWEGVFGKADDSLFDPMSMTALPPQGHTKQRVDAARIPLKLDLAGVPAHLSNVLKDLTHRETLIGIRRILQRPEVVAALHSTLGPEASRFLLDKLKHVATDQVYQFAGTMKAVATVSHAIRRHTGVMAMGYSVATGLKQALGFSTALEVLTARYGVKAPKLLAKGYLEMLRGRGAATQAVMALSGEMRHRLDTVDTDVRNLYQQYLSGRMAQGKGAKVGRAYDAFRFHAFAIIRYAQGYLVDIPTWIAAHEAALQQGLLGDAAVAAADDVLIASQGAGGAKDQALIEANIPGVELFTMFYSYANAYFNRQLTLGRDVGKALQGGPGQFFAELPLLSARFAYLSVLPVLLEELISQAIGQSDGPDDDDNAAAYYGLRVLAYQFYGIPILRDFLPNRLGTQRGAYRMTPAQSAFDAWAKLWGDVEKTANGNAPEARKAARDAVTAAGYAFGLPLGGLWKHVDYLWRYFDGEEEPESVPEFAAALATGKREQK